MKGTLNLFKIAAILICCLLFVGCASTPKAEESNIEELGGTNLVTTTSCETNAIPNTVVSNATTKAQTDSSIQTLPPSQVEEASPPSQPSPPKDNPRPWSIELSANSRCAQIDNTEIYLYKEPKKGGSKELIPHFIDQTKTIDVVFNAHTTPIATNRPVRVFIDPGHGGIDPGAISRDGKTYEKTITLDIAKRLQTYLTGAGFTTLLSRTDNNTTLSLEERSVMANNWNADIFISIHINSSTSTMPNGYETYVLANVGQLSTTMIPSSMTAKDWEFVNATYNGNKNDNGNILLGFAIHRRTVKTSRIPDRGLRRARYNVLRGVTMPAVLVECGYLSSPKDFKLLKTADFRERCARGIYQGICDYAYGRMQPGLAPTPVPQQNTKQNTQPATTPSNPTPAPALQPTVIQTPKAPEQPTINGTPERLIEAMEYKPEPQTPVWTPNYDQDDDTPTPEISAAREKALDDAGISFSPKEIPPPENN